MKTFVIAMILAIMPSAAQASVKIQFGGTADAVSYVNTHSSVTGDSITNDANAPSVTGTLTISLAALVNQPGSSVYYDANGAAFLSGTFTSGGVTPGLLSSGTPTHYVQGDGDTATIEMDFYDDTAIGTGAVYSSQFTLFGDGVPLVTINGIQLPDFANAANLYFSLISREGDEFDYVERYSAGTVTSLVVTASQDTGAVPEPASWALMILGLGLTGAALRRRRPTRLLAAA